MHRYSHDNAKRLFGVVRRISHSGRMILMLGIGSREWATSALICAMILPLLTLPVSAKRVSTPVDQSTVLFEPVNENLPVWTSIWRNLNADIETRLNSLRVTNWTGSATSDDDKKKKKTSHGTKPSTRPAPAGTENSTSSNPKIADVPEPKAAPAATSIAPETKVIKKGTGTTPAALLNQLPSDEHDSVYSYENNLGSPRGQVEMDSANRAAALPIKHRVGTANFSFGLGLASISGRGIDASVGLTYNSRTWNKSCEAYDANGNCTTNHFTYDVEQSWIAPGFSSGFGYLETQAMVRSTHPTTNTGVFTYYTEIVPIGVTDADGTRHQTACASSSQIPGTYETRCDIYQTTDGSNIRIPAQLWVSNPNNSQSVNTSGYEARYFTATYNNGFKITFSGGFLSGESRRHYPVRIRDNNGNRIRIAYRQDQSGSIDHITDTLNREIKFYYQPVSGASDKLVAVTIPGLSTNSEIQTVRFYYEDLTLQTGGFASGSTVTAPTTVRTLKYLYFPATKTGYKYEYNSYFGMIKKITRYVGMTASGTSTSETGSITSDGLFAASTEYNYPSTTGVSDVPKYTTRTDDWQGNTSGPLVTTYNAPEPSPGADYVSTITVPDNGFSIETKSISGHDGLLKETRITKLYGAFSEVLSKTEYKWSADDNRNLTSVEVTNDAGLKKATVFGYDTYGNQTSTRECDYGVTLANCTDSNALRRTVTSYETGSGWITANLLSLPKSITTIVGGVNVSKTTLTYDHEVNGVASAATIVKRSDIGNTNTHDTFFNPDEPGWWETVCPDVDDPGQSALPGGCVEIYHPGYSGQSYYRGNVTKVTRFSDATLSSDPNADISDYEYDIAGNLVSATLSCCNVKTIDYGANFAATGYAYPVSETKGSSPQLTTSATYNLYTGFVVSSTNENGQTTSYEYETDTLRPKKTTYPNGGYVLTEYSDKLVSTTNDLLPGFTRQTTTLDSTHTTESYGYYNGRGQGIRSASETPDGWLISAVEYDTLGRAKKSYNPFYGSTPTASIPSGTASTQVNAVDGLGRTTEIELQDGTKVYTYPNEATVTYTAPNSQSITGTATRVKDQAGKERRQIVDSLGRVVRLDEPTSAGLGDVSTPNQPTFYEYDGNDNLAKVIQSDGTTTQNRRFKYDSLSRLVAEYQVEASATLDLAGTKGAVDNANKWTKVLKYDAHGLLTDGYDARGVHTQMAYDGLNRISSVTYSGETGYQTPAVTYTYDQSRAGAYNTGALTTVETAASGETPATKAEFDYDLMARVSKHRQWIAGQEYDLEYGYNLAGQLVSERYPSGRVVTNTYDANGRLAGVADGSRTYLSNLQFQGLGGSLSSLSYGNGTVQTFGLNDRMQMISQELKRGTEILQKYAYGYGQLNASGTLDTTKNNGQLSQIESWIGTAKQWTQKFSYDDVGRLKQSAEYKGTDGSLTYRQVFDFDRFGNMYRKAASNPSTGQENPLPFTQIEESDISKATNRFATQTTYDEAGNVVSDAKFRGMGFGYDANGRMVKATKANVPDALSVYDAAGMRVAERVNDVWRFSVYDIGGKIVAEYGGIGATDEGGVKYLLSDWQGSTRAVLSNTGNVRARVDYTAYGEEIQTGIGLRTSTQGFDNSTALRQRYGLTERDSATGLDHTWFRKNENRGGRWTSPDPYNGSMSLGDPQSFNRNSYVQNDPINFIDPSGLDPTSPGTTYSSGILWSVWYGNNTDGFRLIAQWFEPYGNGMGGDQTPADMVREKLAFYLQFKSAECEKAIKALGLSDSKLLSAFDKNRFSPGGSVEGHADTDLNFKRLGRGKKIWTSTVTTTVNGVIDFLSAGSMGFLIHELAHVATHLDDIDMYNRLLSEQNQGHISGLDLLDKKDSKTTSAAISRYLNNACRKTDKVDSPLPSSGNGSTSA